MSCAASTSAVTNGAVRYRDNPDAVCELVVEPAADPTDGIREVVKAIVGADEASTGWPATTHNSDIDVTQLTGGITNILYVATNRATDSKVVVRLYGAGTAAFIDRSTENFVFSRLSRMNIGPTFYGLFRNGRVEGFLPARPLESSEMRSFDIFPLIAEAVAEIHSLDLKEIHSTGWLWEKIRQFLELAQKVEEGGTTHPLAADMFTQLQWLQNYIAIRASECMETGAEGTQDDQRAAGRRFGLQEVMCHNDLLSGNILRRDTPGGTQPERQVFLIDYEYAAYNYRAFDIANHISEHCGFEYDYVRTLPDRDFVMAFLREYCRALGSGSAEHEQSFLLGLLDTVYWLLLASHLFWGAWSLVQTRCSSIDFDYAGYAQRRYDAFLAHKSQYATS